MQLKDFRVWLQNDDRNPARKGLHAFLGRQFERTQNEAEVCALCKRAFGPRRVHARRKRTKRGYEPDERWMIVKFHCCGGQMYDVKPTSRVLESRAVWRRTCCADGGGSSIRQVEMTGRITIHFHIICIQPLFIGHRMRGWLDLTIDAWITCYTAYATSAEFVPRSKRMLTGLPITPTVNSISMWPRSEDRGGYVFIWTASVGKSHVRASQYFRLVPLQHLGTLASLQRIRDSRITTADDEQIWHA